MATIERFEDIEAWQRARELTKSIYEATADGLWNRDFGLRDQIRRAAVSVMSNIAEGFERGGKAEFGRFLTMAKGSAGEVRCQLYVALDVGYIDQRAFRQLSALAERTSSMIAGFMNYLKSTNRRAAPNVQTF
jgi:four helix bundle protein